MLRLMFGPVRTRIRPEIERNLQRVDANFCPPRPFISAAVCFPMMHATQGHREFIAHLAAKRSALGISDVMCVGGLASAHETRLSSNGSPTPRFPISLNCALPPGM